jgi:hypothetical protein
MTNERFPTPEIAAGVAALIAHANKVISDHWAERGYTYAPAPTVEVESIGASFARIVTREHRHDGTSSIGSVYCFIAMKDSNTKGLGIVKEGDILKPAGYNKPAKHARGNIWTDLTKLTPYGVEYLK